MRVNPAHVGSGTSSADSGQQLSWVYIERGGDPLQALQGEVALTSLDAAHVGPVDTKDIGEGFLAQAALLAVDTEVLPHSLLEIAFRHMVERCRVLLVSLQTYK